LPEEYKVKPEEFERIMHISLPIRKETIIMGSDTGGEWAAQYKQGNNFAISINTDSKEKADDFFGKLSEGGRITMPMQSTFLGDYFGNFTDKFGINWMVSFNEKPRK
jgi:PhnB protein